MTNKHQRKPSVRGLNNLESVMDSVCTECRGQLYSKQQIEHLKCSYHITAHLNTIERERFIMLPLDQKFLYLFDENQKHKEEWHGVRND